MKRLLRIALNVVLVLTCPFCRLSAQLANQYPHDLGIENDPDVLYVEMFEDGLNNVFSRYDDKKNTAGMSLSPDVPPGSSGQFSIKMTNIGGVNTGGHLYKRFQPGWDSVVYIRYYVKYPSISQGYIHHESVWLGGYNPATTWPNPQAGTCGLGDQRIAIAYEPVGTNTMNTYLYWGDMRHDPNNDCWGNVMIRGDAVPKPIPFDQWLCVEIMVRLNDPVSGFDGELRIWHNGEVVGYWGPGFPNGHWLWDKFYLNAADPPYEGFRWRSDPNLNINYLWIEYYDDQSPANVSHYIQYDHLVVARKPIGPISETSGILQEPVSVSQILLYPNPTNNQLHVHSYLPKEQATLQMVDLTGHILRSAPFNGSDADLDVSGLTTGLYWIEIKSGVEVIHQIFFKN